MPNKQLPEGLFDKRLDTFWLSPVTKRERDEYLEALTCCLCGEKGCDCGNDLKCGVM